MDRSGRLIVNSAIMFVATSREQLVRELKHPNCDTPAVKSRTNHYEGLRYGLEQFLDADITVLHVQSLEVVADLSCSLGRCTSESEDLKRILEGYTHRNTGNCHR